MHHVTRKWNKGLIKTWKLFSFTECIGNFLLEAYVENAENLIDDYQVRGGWSADKETTQRITALYEELKKLSFEPEEWRRLSQLLLLKGSQTEHLQANHQLTPDSIGFICFSY